MKKAFSMKKIFTSLTGIALSLFFASQVPTYAAMMIGDVNQDGIVDFNDYQLIQPMFGTNNASGDFNSNGVVDLKDVNALIASLYAKNGPAPTSTPPMITIIPSNTPVITNSITVTNAPSATPTTKPNTTVTKSPSSTPTTKPSTTVTKTPTTTVPSATPTKVPGVSPTITPIAGSNEIGPVALSYKQGGIWLTPEEIAQIPENNTSWTNLVDWSNKPMNIVSDLPCTAGGTCGHDTTPKAMLA
jgi:hypothetical protein